MINVGIPVVIRGDSWHGGNNYFLSLLDVLDEHAPNGFTFYCLTNRSDLFTNKYSSKVIIAQCDFLTENSKRITQLCKHFQTDIRIAYYAKKFKLDLLTHTLPGKRFTPPTLYWMPDFQHCHLPHLFNEVELAARNKHIETAAQRSENILLSSHSAKNDFREFFPFYNNTKTQVVQFSPHIRGADFDLFRFSLGAKIESARTKSNDYFYLPNQFWMHKNHELVLEALALVENDFSIISTGFTEDHRNAGHFQYLMQRVKELNLSDRFVVKGLVSREQVIHLMAESIAVINPSLFEGWSTTVEEAKAFGKTALLSDIPVHREQAHPNALYFDPNCASSLATLLDNAYGEKDISMAKEYRNLDLHFSRYQASRQQFAKDYLAVVQELHSIKAS